MSGRRILLSSYEIYSISMYLEIKSLQNFNLLYICRIAAQRYAATGCK
jgi:hypothetical protein